MPIGRRLLRPSYSALASALLPARLCTYVSHSTFHISKTLNHLSMFSRACLAVIDRSKPAARSRLTPARLGQPSGRTRRDATTAGFVRASRTFVLIRGIATRDFEELPCGKVGPCLELPLGGVSRAIRVVSARTGYIGTAWLIPHGDNTRRPCTGDRDKY